MTMGGCGSATVADALTALAAACPVAGGGPVLTPNDHSLCTGYLLNPQRGREFVDRADAPLADGDRLLLISSAAGGRPVSSGGAARRKKKLRYE